MVDFEEMVESCCWGFSRIHAEHTSVSLVCREDLEEEQNGVEGKACILRTKSQDSGRNHLLMILFKIIIF